MLSPDEGLLCKKKKKKNARPLVWVHSGKILNLPEITVLPRVLPLSVICIFVQFYLRPLSKNLKRYQFVQFSDEQALSFSKIPLKKRGISFMFMFISHLKTK